MNLLKMLIGLIVLTATAQMAAAIKAGGDDFVDPDTMAQISNVVRVAAKRKAKPRHPVHREPAPPPPPAARCPVDVLGGKGTLAWDDLRDSFDQKAITNEDDFAKAFVGNWVKVGEAKDRHHWGSYDPQGLHIDASGCRSYPGLGTYCDVNAVSRTGWIGTYDYTSGPLGTPHYGIQLATFDRLHQVKGDKTSYPLKFEEGGAEYVIKGHVDADGDSWIHGMRRVIRVIAPQPGQPVTTAVMEESRLDKGDGRYDRTQYPEVFAYFQYCKVSN